MRQRWNSLRAALGLVTMTLTLCSGLVLFCGCDNDGGHDGDAESSPVDVSGTWTLVSIVATIESVYGTMTLSQSGNIIAGSFQEKGSLPGHGNYGTIDGTVSGNSISFNYIYTSYAIKGHRYLYWGKVDGNAMTGKSRSANCAEGVNEVRWKATRQ